MDTSRGKQRRGRAKERIAELFELPRDSILDVPRIVVVGNSELSIENHLGIVEYTSDQVEIATTKGRFAVRGKDLTISGITQTLIRIEGLIEHLDFLP